MKSDNNVAGSSIPPVRVKLCPRPVASIGLGSFRTNLEAIRNSQVSLAQARQLGKFPDRNPLLQLRLSPRTGLPTSLNGVLPATADLTAVQPLRKASADWLLSSSVSMALFGNATDGPVIKLVPVDPPPDTSGSLSGPSSTANSGSAPPPPNGAAPLPMVHTRFQQYHRDLPVLGAGAVVHSQLQASDCSATSAFLPIDPNQDFSGKPIEETEAMRVAALELLGHIDGVDAIGVCLYLAEQWMKGAIAGDGMQEVFGRLVQSMLARPGDIKVMRPTPHVNRGPLLSPPTLGTLFGFADRARTSAWTVEVVPYLGHRQFILPFASDAPNANPYHLAYQVLLSSPGQIHTWRVFVDALTGDVLGDAEEQGLGAVQIFASSADVGNNHPVDPQPYPSDQDVSFMHLFEWAQGAIGAPISLANIQNSTTPAHVDAVSIAFHARTMFNYMLGLASLDDQPRLTAAIPFAVRVGVVDPANRMAIKFSSGQGSPFINFQTGDGAGLTIDSSARTVHLPSRDPEVVYHEIVHALMYRLNSSPFEQQRASAPFTDALLEGYAIYLARSLAHKNNDNGDFSTATASFQGLWARGAYHPGDFGDEWSVVGTGHTADPDALTDTNIYPPSGAGELGAYHVGMVWARALWDMREVICTNLTDRPVARRIELADELAVQGFHYVLGWATSFEMAAEGILDIAPRLSVPASLVDNIWRAFSARRIRADIGIRSILENNGDILYADDEGVHVWHVLGNPTSWGLDGRTVVGLASDGNTIYAATPDGVQSRDCQATGAWQPLEQGTQGRWPINQVPLCIGVRNGLILVGTGEGTWVWDPANKMNLNPSLTQIDWRALPGMAGPLQKVVLNTAFWVDGTDIGISCATLDLPAHHLLAKNFGWESWGKPTAGAQRVDSTAIATSDRFVWAGTENDGIWRVPLFADPTVKWDQIAKKGDLNSGGVLALYWDAPRDRLYAATTSGLYKLDAAGAWSQITVPGAGQSEIVTAVFVDSSGNLFAGTSTLGVVKI